MKPVIGIRPIIDGRQGGIRESLEAQTMGMALRAKKLIEDNLFYTDGTPVKVVVNDGTKGGGAESVALPSPDRAGADMSQGASGTE